MNGIVPSSANLSDPFTVYSDGGALAALQTLITEQVVYKLVPTLRPATQHPQTKPSSQQPVSTQPPLPQGYPGGDDRIGGWVGGVRVPPIPDSNSGFVSGLPTSPLRDPLFVGGVGGGGLLVGPNNAMFGDRGGEGEMWIGPDGMPVPVPPGARFDPFGPVQPPSRGRGRGGTPGIPFGMYVC